MKENFQPLTEELYDLAFCPREKYEDLKCLAAPEDWGAELNVLKSYIRYLYKRIARVHNENHGESYLVYQIPTMLCFDTGLFTSRYESIYAVFEPNIKEGKQPWYLKNFLRKSDKGLENILDFPELALAVQKKDGYYAGRTCLTLEMAYNNARLIIRPEKNWIHP